MRHLSCAVVIASVCIWAAGATAAEPSFVVRSDVAIGSFAVKRSGAFAGAIRAYGEPDSRRRLYGSTCIATWRSYGLTMTFYNLGGEDPCTPGGGRFASAIMRGSRWRTT